MGFASARSDRRLHAVIDPLDDADPLKVLCDKALDGTVGLAGADFGNLQLRDAATGSLRIVAQQGFSSEFLEYFAVVDDARSACGRAANEGAQVVIVDVNEDHRFAPHRPIAASAGFQAVQSTPLVGSNGNLLGIISTHWRRPHLPSDQDLRLIGIVGNRVGATLSRWYTSPHDDTPEPWSGRAFPAPDVLAATSRGQVVETDDDDELLRQLVSYVEQLEAANQALRDSLRVREIELLNERERIAAELRQVIIHRIFDAGLLLDGVRTIIKDPAAERRLVEASEHLDSTIREIRTRTFDLGGAAHS